MLSPHSLKKSRIECVFRHQLNTLQVLCSSCDSVNEGCVNGVFNAFELISVHSWPFCKKCYCFAILFRNVAQSKAGADLKHKPSCEIFVVKVCSEAPKLMIRYVFRFACQSFCSNNFVVTTRQLVFVHC